MTRDEISGWIWSAKAKKEEYERTVEECNKKIARLKPVYQKLGEIKSDFKSAKKNTEEVFKEKGTWRGEKHSSFCNAGDSLCDVSEAYYRHLDTAQDEVNRKIGELENQKLKLIPLIGDLAATINWLWTEFNNAVN